MSKTSRGDDQAGDQRGPGRSNRSGRGYSKGRGRKYDSRRGLKNASFGQLQQYFAACSCCGYFLTGYRVLHGQAALEQAGRDMTDGWLTLVWDQQTRELLHRTFGMRTDVESIHYEATCSECQRRIVFAGDTVQLAPSPPPETPDTPTDPDQPDQNEEEAQALAPSSPEEDLAEVQEQLVFKIWVG